MSANTDVTFYQKLVISFRATEVLYRTPYKIRLSQQTVKKQFVHSQTDTNGLKK
jgi:hypothetical protein